MLHWERPAKHWAQGPVDSLPILPACRHKGYVIICIIWSVVNRLICTHNISKVGRHHHVLRLWLHADDHLFAWEMGLCQRLTASTFSLESLCWALSSNRELDCRLKPRLAFSVADWVIVLVSLFTWFEYLSSKCVNWHSTGESSWQGIPGK